MAKINQQIYSNPLTAVRPQSGKTLGWKPIYVNTFSNGQTSEARYFSGLEAEIYFGDIYIDDAVQIDFNVQQNTMPLFGYNSFTFDDIARGSRLISGRFVLNFTRANYLYYILNTLKKSSLNSGSQKVVATKENTIEQYDDNYQTKISKLTQDPIVIHEKSPLWNHSFDIWVSYGNAKQSSPAVGSTILVLKDIVLNGCSQQVSISGEPIFEEYSFVARDIQFVPLSESSSDSADTTSESESITVSQVTYSTLSDYTNKYGYLNIEYSSTVPIVDIAVMLPMSGSKDWIRTGSGGEKTGSSNGVISYNKKHKVIESWRSTIVNSGKTKFPLSLMFYYYPDGQTTEHNYQVDVTVQI